MHPTIEEISRWRVGDLVRPDVQKRWQHDLALLDAELAALRQQVATMTQLQPEAPAKAGKR